MRQAQQQRPPFRRICSSDILSHHNSGHFVRCTSGAAYESMFSNEVCFPRDLRAANLKVLLTTNPHMILEHYRHCKTLTGKARSDDYSLHALAERYASYIQILCKQRKHPCSLCCTDRSGFDVGKDFYPPGANRQILAIPSSRQVSSPYMVKTSPLNINR